MLKCRWLFTRIWPGELQPVWIKKGRCPWANNTVFLNNNKLSVLATIRYDINTQKPIHSLCRQWEKYKMAAPGSVLSLKMEILQQCWRCWAEYGRDDDRIRQYWRQLDSFAQPRIRWRYRGQTTVTKRVRLFTLTPTGVYACGNAAHTDVTRTHIKIFRS